MKKPTISVIAVISENRVIGKEGRLPWDIPEDLRRFRALTKGHPVIMGRKTFDSIGRLLPDRPNIIISRNTQFHAPGAHIVHSLDSAIKLAKSLNSNEIFIIGGAQIYAAALPTAEKLYLTIVKGNFAGDAYFPDYSRFKTVVSRQVRHDQNHQYTFLELIP